MVSDVYDTDWTILSSDIPPPPGEESSFKETRTVNVSGFNQILAKALSFGFSDIHFITKTAADGMLKLSDLVPVAEAKLVSKLTDEPVGDIIEDRHNSTAKSQEAIVDSFKSIGHFMSKNVSKAHSHVMEVVHETMVTNPVD